MPWQSPSFPRGPYRFVRREYVIVKYRTDRAALQRVVVALEWLWAYLTLRRGTRLITGPP
jgi:acetoacetate decarboxylase